MARSSIPWLACVAILIAIGIVIWAMAERAQRGAALFDSRLSDDERSERPPSPGPTAAPIVRPRPFDPHAESEPSAAASRSDSRTGALTAHVIWGDDKTPAAGVVVWVIEWAARSGVMKARNAVVGVDGTFRLADLVPGRVVLQGDRGGVQGVDVTAGSDHDVTLEIPAGATVEGRVLALDGTPVVGADIWVSQYATIRHGAVVTRSDARGAFTLRSVGGYRSLAARAAGHSQSEPQQVQFAAPGDVVKVDLRLGGPAGSVFGFVQGPDGAPVAGAVAQMLSPPIRVKTDGSGAFTIESVPPGDQTLEIRMPGLAPWSGAVSVKAGRATEIEIGLEREAVVVGTVKLATGAAAAGATIAVGPSEFLSSSTHASADGSFRLGSLAPGRIEIIALIRRGETAGAILECAAGAEVRWDPVLDSGPRIVGVVRDERDQPLEGWIVMARPADGRGRPDRWRGSSTTDAEGRFTIVNCPPETTFNLEVRDKRSIGTVRGSLDSVRPGAEEHVIRISANDLGSFKGRLLGPDGRPVVGSIRAQRDDVEGSITVKADPATGNFMIPSVRPGMWRLSAHLEPLAALDLGEHEVKDGTTVDLGEFRAPENGRLVIDLEASAEVADQVTYTLTQHVPSTAGQVSVWTGSRTLSHRGLPNPLPLVPGTWSLVVGGNRVEEQRSDFEIASGKEARVSISTRFGVACSLRFSFPEGVQPDLVTFTLVPARGGASHGGYASWDGKARTVVGACVVQPGSHHIFAHGRSCAWKQQEITVPAGVTSIEIPISLEPVPAGQRGR